MQHKPSGLTAARFLKTIAANKDSMSRVGYVEATKWPDAHIIKAAVAPTTTVNSSALVPVIGQDFMALVRPMSIIGRLQKLRRQPFGVRTVVQTAGARGHWIPEFGNKSVQVSAFQGFPALLPRKVASISVVTEELAQASDAENILLQDLSAAAVATLDESFIDPASAEVLNERPASVTNGQPSIPSSGTDAEAIRADIRALVSNFKGDLASAVLIMDAETAVAIAMLQASLGGASFDIGQGTGILFGLSVLISGAVPSDTSGSVIALVDASAVQISGGENADLHVSREATVLMDSAPGSGASQLVSLWQTNSVGLLAEIYVNWRLVRPGAAVTVTGVSYGG
ncbi:MAG TPA: hypothetical protein VN156_04340 [Pseudomonas sp.]|nr:hypothetical protein [Pseudomonas sp.]